MSYTTYTLDNLYAAFKPLFPDGIPGTASAAPASSGDFTGWEHYEGDIDDISDIRLPGWIQKLIDAEDAEDASREFFNLCMGLFDLGCTSDCIIDVLEGVSWLPERYWGRVDVEVYRCLSKYDPERSGCLEPFTALESETVSVDIPLAVTATSYHGYRKALESVVGRNRVESLLEAGRFIDYAFSEYEQSVISLPCATGKTTLAVLHAVCNAGKDNRFLIVVQNRDNIKDICKLFRRLGRIKAGVYTGFNADECHGLTGENYSYKDCLRRHRDSKCRHCRKKRSCRYGSSGSAFNHDIVITTHQSYINLCEKNRDFSKWTVIIDENPAVFTVEVFTPGEIYTLRNMFANSAFPFIRNLLTDIFPFLDIVVSGMDMNREYHFTELSDIKFVPLAEKVTPQMLRTLTGFAHSEGCPEYHHDLFYRFVLFIRTAAQCSASVSAAVFKDRLVLKKLRVDFRSFCNYRRLFILDASSDLSQVVFSPEMPVVTCSDLDKYRKGFIRMHAVISNPTKSRRALNIEPGLELFRELIGSKRRSGKVLLSHNPVNSSLEQELLDHVTDALSESSEVVTSSSGLLRGTNEFRDCLSAFLASTGWFTTICECALTIALQEQRDIPWSRFMVTDEDGRRRPRMSPKGCFTDPAMQKLFMAGCIDRLYQAAYRTAVRDGRTVDIFLPIPSVDWLITLHKLMPCEVVAAKGSAQLREQAFIGISQLINMPAGTEIEKKEAAGLCGYKTWKQANRTLKSIYRELFECTGEMTLIRRKTGNASLKQGGTHL